MAKDIQYKINIPDYAAEVMDKLLAAGEQVYLVGGSLRDALLGLPAHDYDMASSALPLRCREIFSSHRVIDTGLKHGTLTVLSHGNPIEITTFRIDGEYTDSRRPDSVSFTPSLECDLARRDFTVNAMAYSRDGKLTDLFSGVDDLKAGIIRAVGEPQRRFGEDALRIMRAFRFCAQLGFKIDEATLEGARACREGLAHISRERIGNEFLQLICSKEPETALSLMQSYEIMPYVLGDYCPQPSLFGLLSKMPSQQAGRLGLLLSGCSQAEAETIIHNLKCSNKQKTGALAVARGALLRVSTPREAVALRAAVGDYAPLAVKASVLLGISPKEGEALVCESRTPAKISDLEIGGKELLYLGFEGKELGAALDFLLSAVMDDPSLNTSEALTDLALKKLKARS